MSLQAKVAIISGGGGGIGFAVAQRFAADGARIVIAEIDERAGNEAVCRLAQAGATVEFVRTDVSDQGSTEALAQTVVERFGGIDILVNSAAYLAAIEAKPIEEISVADWDKVMAVNLRGPFLTVRAVLPHMKRRRAGKIVNVSSNTVFSGGPTLGHYVTSKAGLIGFTRTLAREAGPFGICVNTVTPGLTETPAAERAIPSKRFEAVVNLRALGRRQSPTDLAGAISFLCSSDADFITGQTINVDGGQIFL